MSGYILYSTITMFIIIKFFLASIALNKQPTTKGSKYLNSIKEKDEKGWHLFLTNAGFAITIYIVLLSGSFRWPNMFECFYFFVTWTIRIVLDKSAMYCEETNTIYDNIEKK